MSWDSYRKLDDDKQVNENPHAWDWETENIPLLLSGFCEITKDKKPKSRLSIQILMQRDIFRVKVSDRVAKMSTWVDFSSLEDFLIQLEKSIKDHDVFWENDSWMY